MTKWILTILILAALTALIFVAAGCGQKVEPAPPMPAAAPAPMPPLPAQASPAKPAAATHQPAKPAAKPVTAKPAPKPATAKPTVQPAAVIYTCAMHPEVQQSTPGKCPKCGMNLVKKG